MPTRTRRGGFFVITVRLKLPSRRCFALTVAFSEVRNEFDVVPDVRFELAEVLAEFVCWGRERSKEIEFYI
jgi:hypothetical protein